jgi:hypothetical protein
MCRREEEAGRAALHPESDGLELRYIIGTKPSNVEATSHYLISTKATFVVTFKSEDKGKYIFAFARWKNFKDDTLSSGWSDMITVMIA